LVLFALVFTFLMSALGPGAGYWQPPQGGFGIVAPTSVAGGLNRIELPPTTWRFPSDPAIEAVRVTAQEVFSSTQVTWADAAGQPVAGFRPAAIYPPLFARDLSWIAPAARLFYSPGAWQSGVEAFLRRQYTATTRSDEDGWQAGAGALPGVLHSDGRVDKASAVSDEETSLIGAAYSLFEVQGAAWLTAVMTGTAGQATGSQATGSRCYECEVQLGGLQAEQGTGSRSHDSQDAAGLAAPRVIDRLDAALTWLWDNRREAASGLIWRGHTTDWGDVTLDVTAPNPTDLDPARAVRTASLFDQVLAWRAARQLATMWEALGAAGRAAAWRQRGADLQMAANRDLWQPRRGFYRLHMHLAGPCADGAPCAPWQHPFDEGRLLAISNAVAVQTGFCSAAQARAILDTLAQAQLAAGAHQPGLSLWPPYASWTFPQPDMQAGRYQNGGVWDWWAGVQIEAEFRAGYSRRALLHLRQVAHAWASHPGQVYEWQAPGWRPGMRSDDLAVVSAARDYAAGAATVLQAVTTGLYGVEWQANGALRLTVRLGEASGAITSTLPGTARSLSYTYTPTADALRLDYRTWGSGAFPLWLRLPPGRDTAAVRLDAADAVFTVERVGDDQYVALTALPGIHTVAVRTLPSPPWWQSWWLRWRYLREPGVG
jgi:hypothetical protein